MAETESIESAGVLTPTTIGSIERASIDVQVATAKQYPRSMARFHAKAIEFATIDAETAEACIYRRPVGKDANGKQTYAEGNSIRMAEIVFATFGNLRAGGQIVEQDERQVKARGFAFDVENNTALTAEVVESTVKRDGRPYDERMRVVVAKAAMSKAIRDAIFRVVPRAIVKPVERAVRDLLYGSQSALDVRRTRAIGWASKLGIAVDRVWHALGVSSGEEMTAVELELLTGLKTAIQSGEETIDAVFPPITTDADGKRRKIVFAPKLPKAEGKEEPAPLPAENGTDAGFVPGAVVLEDKPPASQARRRGRPPKTTPPATVAPAPEPASQPRQTPAISAPDAIHVIQIQPSVAAVDNYMTVLQRQPAGTFTAQEWVELNHALAARRAWVKDHPPQTLHGV